MVNTESCDQRYHRCMAENSLSGPPLPSGTGGIPASRGQFPGVAAGPPSWPSTPPRGQSRALTSVTLAIALIAIGVAIAGWFRPSQVAPPPHPAGLAYSDQQIADAKTQACAAVDTTHKGVVLQSGANKKDAVSNDPGVAEGQSANARLAIIGGSWYLRDRLGPATPQPLADTIRHLSNTMLDIGANYLAGTKDADAAQSALLSDGDATFARALELCK
jgi:hypothetical protein